MAYQVLARKYRPQRFADVAGQDHVTVTLMNALTQQRIAHGYIFSGHRGIGKTTIARILACALNCRNPIGSEIRPSAEPCEVCESCLEIRAGNATDVIEIDAATNRGIDEIRELRDAARYRPSRDKYKIYILDEAHQITDAAFNALLKTLEEPPDHIVFMMATTQPEDIPQTVRSRCQHFNFHAVKLVDILGELRGIAQHEGVDADEAALNLLAEAGDGSMRDALSVMDQAIASAPVENGRARLDAGQIRELMGTVANGTFERILQAVDGNRSAEVMTIANELMDAGNSPAQLARQAVRYLRSCVIAKITGLKADGEGEFAGSELLQISPDEQRRAARTAALFSEEELTRFLQTMLRTFDELGYRQEQRFHFELGLLKLVHLRRLLPVEEVLSSLSGGTGAAPRTPVPTPQPRAAAPTPSPTPASPSKPAFSPFDQDKSRRYSGVEAGHNPAPAVTAPPVASAPPVVAPPPVPPPVPAPVVIPSIAAVAAESIPVPAPVAVPEPVAVAAPLPPVELPPVAPPPVVSPPATPPQTPVILSEVEGPASLTLTAEAEAKPELAEPEAPATAPEFAALQAKAVDALSNAPGQTSAADAISESTWKVEAGTLTIQTQCSKTMLPMIVNPDAEKLIKATMREYGITKVVILPGVPNAAPKKARAARAGSPEAKAKEHPMIQQAQRLFDAEIRNVIDLSEGN